MLCKNITKFLINYQTTRQCDSDRKCIAHLATEVPVIAVSRRGLSREKSQLHKQLETTMSKITK